MDKDLENLCKIALNGYEILKEKDPKYLGTLGFEIIKDRIIELQFLLNERLYKMESLCLKKK